MFEYKTQIFLHHTDAAGRLFFANQFYLIYEAKEKFFDHIGLPIAPLLEHSQITFPLVHAESDYKAVLKAGDHITIRVNIEKIGATSIVFVFDIFKWDGSLAGTARTVNVTVDKVTGVKVKIPLDWRKKFEFALG